MTGYDRSAAKLPGGTDAHDFDAMDDVDEMIRIAVAIEIPDVSLTDPEVAEILAFLDALTDATPPAGALGAPQHVPSGLPIDPF